MEVESVIPYCEALHGIYTSDEMMSYWWEHVFNENALHWTLLWSRFRNDCVLMCHIHQKVDKLPGEKAVVFRTFIRDSELRVRLQDWLMACKPDSSPSDLVAALAQRRADVEALDAFLGGLLDTGQS